MEPLAKVPEPYPQGRFSSDGRSFEITDIHALKAPWSNVLSNGKFGSVWTERGGAFCWCGNSVLDRLTRWDQDLVLNPARRFVFLADENGIVRTLTPLPAGRNASWKVTHGPGWTCYTGTCDRFITKFTAVVHPWFDAESWFVEVDRLGRDRDWLRLYSVQDVLMGTWPDAHREFHKLFIESRILDLPLMKRRALAFTKKLDTRPGQEEHWNTPFPGILTHATTGDVRGFETDRLRFHGYGGSMERPDALLNPAREGLLGCWGDAMAGLDVRLDPTQREVTFVTAYSPNENSAVETLEKALAVTRGDAIRNAEQFWNDQVGPVMAETPSPELDVMASHWLRYQTISGRIYARCGLYQASGAYGFRDQLQDSLHFLAYAPERAHAQLKLHLHQQFRNGEVLHWWHPETGTGPRTKCSDDFLWPIMAAAELHRETGSARFLSERVPYRDGAKKSIWDHLCRSIDLAWERRSPRGLPLLGECDWNDGLSSAGDKGRGESVWVGHFLHLLLLEMARLAEAHEKDGAEFMARADELRAAVNEFGWDGSWYMQGTTDEGNPIGSAKCSEGRIHLNAQTWSVIGRTATTDAARALFSDRASQAMSAVKDQLVVDWGVLLLSPAYKTPDRQLGYITRYAPGARENGGVYTHGAVWTARAARILKDRELLSRVVFSLLPSMRGRDPRYRAEPYVTPGNIDGLTTPTPGKGGWTWYTGSSAWLVRIIFEDLLGIRSSVGGMTIDPLVPTGWTGFKATRPFRGRLLRIEARRGSSAGITIGTGAKKREIAGSFIPEMELSDSKKELNIFVEYE
ncbi:MAG: hypothetical protein AAB229_00220 [Candidatus Hydrogenedentota bacterium]